MANTWSPAVRYGNIYTDRDTENQKKKKKKNDLKLLCLITRQFTFTE